MRRPWRFGGQWWERINAPLVAAIVATGLSVGLFAGHRAGLRVAAWTVNAEADIRRMLDLGVDIVISDQPDLALRLAGRPPRAP